MSHRCPVLERTRAKLTGHHSKQLLQVQHLTMASQTSADPVQRQRRLPDLFIDNHLGLIAAFNRAAGAVVIRHPDIRTDTGKHFTWTDIGPTATRVGAEVHNGVAFQEITPTHFLDAVEHVHDHFSAQGGRPFHWLVGPESQAEQELALISFGLHLDEEEPAMVAGVDHLDLDDSDLKRMDGGKMIITPVTNSAEVQEWVETWGYDSPLPVVEHWVKVYSHMVANLASAQLAMFVARLGGSNDGERLRAIGTGYIWCSDAGVASVQYIVTLPSFRGLGIGTALTLHAMRLARERGCGPVVLTASPSGRRVYERLGFVDFGLVKTFNWEPAT
jgi:GNAT superfamily N-acetyltransferase